MPPKSKTAQSEGQASKGQVLLENAYKLETPADSVAYYRDFAATYDSDFAAGLGWNAPRAVAAAYREAAGPEDVPLADIGCGTGLVAVELGSPMPPTDGMDISPEMLAAAEGKKLYRRFYEVDLTGDLSAIRNDYGAVLSAGTFTRGHLGPEVLRSLLAIARSGALFVIGVNRKHYEAKDFERALHAMEAEGLIDALRIDEAKMYAKAGHDHSGDIAMILRFRRG